MSELNREWLLEAQAWARREIQQMQIRQANAPLTKGFRSSTDAVVNEDIPAIVAAQREALRDAVQKLEARLGDSDRLRAEAERKRQTRMTRAQARTDALRAWLEAIS